MTKFKAFSQAHQEKKKVDPNKQNEKLREETTSNMEIPKKKKKHKNTTKSYENMATNWTTQKKWINF